MDFQRLDNSACLTNTKGNKILKTREDLLACFNELHFKEKFSITSEAILKFVSSIISSDDKICIADEVKCAIENLIFGLASSKSFSRHGSYTTLQALLQLHHELLPFTLGLIDTYFKTEAESDHKIHDKAMGITLAYGAIIRSGCAFDDPSILKRIIMCLAFQNDVLAIEPIAGQFLANFLVMYKEHNVAKLLWKELGENLQQDLRNLPLRLLWLRIIISRDEFLEGLSDVQNGFQNVTFSQDSFGYIASIFKEYFAKGVNITPMIEDYFQSLLLYRNGSGDGTDVLASFLGYAIDVDENISNIDVIFNFNIAQMALPHLTTGAHVEAVLSCGLMEQLVNYNTWDDEAVGASARGLMSAILQLVVSNKNKDSDIQLGVLNRLTSTSVRLGFDSATKTTLLQQSHSHLSVETIRGLSEALVNSFKDNRGAKDARDVEVWLYMSRLISHPAMAGSEHVKWRAAQVQNIIKFTFFRKMHKEFRAKLKDIFLRSLKPPTYITIRIEDQVEFVDHVVTETASYMKDHQEKCTLDSESKDAFEMVSQKMQNLREDESLLQKHSSAFRLLYGRVILHLFVDKKGSIDLIEKIDKCFEKVKSAVTHSPGADPSSPDGDDWVEEMLHLLLFILSKGEKVWRKVVISVFKNICHNFEPNSISILTDVICPKYKKNNDRYEDEDEDYDDEVDDETDDDDNEDKDDDNDDAESDESDDDDDESDITDDDESDDDDDLSDDEASDKNERKTKLLQLKMEMQKLACVDADCVDLDSVPEEELENFDKKMNVFFGQLRALRNAKKREEKQAKKYNTSQLHFICRACDLVEALINEAPSLALFLPLLKPLLLAMDKKEGTEAEEKQFLLKLNSIFNDLVKIKRFAKPGSVSIDDVAAELESLMIFSRRLSKRVNKQIGMCCLYLIQSGINLSELDEREKQTDRLFAVYAKHLEIMFKKDSEAMAGPLHLENGSIALVLDKLVDLTFRPSVRAFKKKQGVATIKMIILNQKARVKMRGDLLQNIHRKLSDGIVNTFDSVSDGKDLQIRLCIDLVDLLRTLKRIHASNPELSSSFNWPGIGSSLASFHQRIPLTEFKNLKKPFYILATLMGVELKSSQVCDENAEARGNKNTKKEQKKSKNEKSRVESDMEVDNEVEENGVITKDGSNDEEIEDKQNTKKEKLTKKERKEKRKRAIKEAKARKKAKTTKDESTKRKHMNNKLKKQTKMRRANKLLNVPELYEFSFTTKLNLENVD